MISTGAGDDAMEVEAVGDTAHRRGDDAEAGARMDCDDDGEEGGVPWVTVPWAANSGEKANKRGKRSGHKGGEYKKKTTKQILTLIDKRVLGHPDGRS